MTQQPFAESLAALRKLADIHGYTVSPYWRDGQVRIVVSRGMWEFSRIEDALTWVMKQPTVKGDRHGNQV